MDQTTTTITIPVTVDIRLVGFLAHDNILFDRKCSNEGCRNMFNTHATCPRCGTVPQNLLTKKNTRLCYSEGTFYPQLGTRTKEEYLKSIKTRKGAMYPTFRSRLVSFADSAGNLMVPTQHPNLLKGSKIELRVKNHLCLFTMFNKDDGTMGVELMFHIFPQYGDTLTVLSGPNAIKTGVTTSPVNTTLTKGVTTDATPMSQLIATIASVLSASKVEPTTENIVSIITALNLNPSATTEKVEVTSPEPSGSPEDIGFYPEGYDGIMM